VYIDSEWQTTWQKPNGQKYVIITKYKPFNRLSDDNYKNNNLNYGYENGYNHKFIQTRNQLYFNFER
jgi:hypothetical protein